MKKVLFSLLFFLLPQICSNSNKNNFSSEFIYMSINNDFASSTLEFDEDHKALLPPNILANALKIQYLFEKKKRELKNDYKHIANRLIEINRNQRIMLALVSNEHEKSLNEIKQMNKLDKEWKTAKERFQAIKKQQETLDERWEKFKDNELRQKKSLDNKKIIDDLNAFKNEGLEVYNCTDKATEEIKEISARFSLLETRIEETKKITDAMDQNGNILFEELESKATEIKSQRIKILKAIYSIQKLEKYPVDSKKGEKHLNKLTEENFISPGLANLLLKTRKDIQQIRSSLYFK